MVDGCNIEGARCAIFEECIVCGGGDRWRGTDFELFIPMDSIRTSSKRLVFVFRKYKDLVLLFGYNKRIL